MSNEVRRKKITGGAHVPKTVWDFPSVKAAADCAAELEAYGAGFELRDEKLILQNVFWNTETMSVIDAHGGR